jgi:hypothetical protein
MPGSCRGLGRASTAGYAAAMSHPAHILLVLLAAAAGLTAQRTADAEALAAALATLEAYAPAAKTSPPAEVAAAYDLLHKQVPRLAKQGGPIADRLRARLLADERWLPSRKDPAKVHDPLRRLLVRFADESLLLEPSESVRAHATAAQFPGSVPAGTTTSTRTLTIDLAVPGRHSTGLYAAPGARVTASFDRTPPAGLVVRIGAHSDNITRRDAWPRMPRITRTFAASGERVAAACAFGGLVYVELPKPDKGSLLVTLEGAVESPWFVLGTTTPEQWQAARSAPGPWAELATAKVVLTVPSEHVRTLDDPTAVLQFWDRALDSAATLAARPLERLRAERYVADLEISAGYMHAGYPIMTHLDAAKDMVDLARMQQAPWGLFHELGHNHQEKAWTFAGTGEVTVNLFSLYLCETLCGRGIDRAWGGNVVRAKQRFARHRRDGTKPWLGDGGKEDLALRLYLYVQLQQAFGWRAFTDVFAEYRTLTKEQLPTDDAARRDEWLIRMSRRVQKNLGPFFVGWGLETSDEARRAVADLPEWLPPDWSPQ